MTPVQASFWELASQQSFSIVLLLAIAWVLWKSFRADLAKKDEKYDTLEKDLRALEREFRETMIKVQRDNVNMNERTMQVLEENTALLAELKLIIKQLRS